MMVWILRIRFFGEGHRLSGLDPEHLGAQSPAAYGRRRQAAVDGVVGSLARRKARAAERAAEDSDGRGAGPESTQPDDAVETVTSGKDGEGR